MKIQEFLKHHQNPKYVFDPKDWEQHLGIIVNGAGSETICWEPSIFATQPFPNSRNLRDHAFLFMPEEIEGEPLTIMWWHRFCMARHGEFALDANPWYAKEKFATHTTPQRRWHAGPVNTQPQTIGHGFEAQLLFMKAAKVYTITPAVVKVTANLLCYFKNGTFPDHGRRARCLEKLPSGARVNVGNPGRSTFGIGAAAETATIDTGLALERIPWK